MSLEMGPPSMSGKALGFQGYTSSNPSPNSSPLHRLLLWYHNPQIMIFMCREPTLFQTLLTQSAHAVLTIPLSVRARRDKLILVPNPKGNFTVKSALLHCTQANQHLQPFQWAMEKTLENQALERVKMLLWRIEANALPNKENLQRRVPLNDSSCILCQQKQDPPPICFSNAQLPRPSGTPVAGDSSQMAIASPLMKASLSWSQTRLKDHAPWKIIGLSHLTWPLFLTKSGG